MSVTGGIMAGIGLAGSIGSAAIGSSAASDAASTQANAANNAANLQYQASQNALNFQKDQYNTTQGELSPYLQSGASGLSSLDYLLGLNQPSSITPGTAAQTGNGTSLAATPNTSLGGFGSLLQAYPGGKFTAPTANDLQTNDPGYQARMQLGTDALQRSAAASGNLLTGGTAEALNAYAQNYASNEYSNYYNQAYNTYSSNYNQYEQQQNNTYNRLASLAGMGQQTASTLGTLGQSNANSVQNNLLSTAAQQGQDYQNAAAANASGIVGSANAWGGAVNSGTSNLSNLYLLNSLYGGGSGGGFTYAP